MKNFIYIPGLGDQQTVDRQKKYIAKWNNKNRRAVVVDARWQDKTEKYQPKFERVLTECKEFIVNSEGSVCVVGSSAGASMAVNVFVALNLDGMVSIAGKMKNADAIGSRYRINAPYFYYAVADSHRNIENLSNEQKQKILTISPLVDAVVAHSDMVISGAKNIRILVPGHVSGIAYSITLGSNNIFRWFDLL